MSTRDGRLGRCLGHRQDTIIVVSFPPIADAITIVTTTPPAPLSRPMPPLPPRGTNQRSVPAVRSMFPSSPPPLPLIPPRCAGESAAPPRRGWLRLPVTKASARLRHYRPTRRCRKTLSEIRVGDWDYADDGCAWLLGQGMGIGHPLVGQLRSRACLFFLAARGLAVAQACCRCRRLYRQKNNKNQPPHSTSKVSVPTRPADTNAADS